MKCIILVISLFAVLHFTGCQENSITDPQQDSRLQKTDDPSVTHGTILLEGMFQDPHPVINSYYLINGEIQFRHALQLLDPIPPNPQYLVSLDLTVSANFTYLCTVCDPQIDAGSAGKISISVNDNFYVSKDGIYILEKAFNILGSDGMILICRFLITTDGVGLNEMWLVLDGEDQNQTHQ